MKIEYRLFLWVAVFMLPVAAVYGFASQWEPVGTTALLLTFGLAAMVYIYFHMVARRIEARPEDDEYGEIAQGAGEQGVFSPWSWWPLVIGLAAALVFLGLAIGWWIAGIGAAVAAIGLVGWVFEFSRGQHEH